MLSEWLFARGVDGAIDNSYESGIFSFNGDEETEAYISMKKLPSFHGWARADLRSDPRILGFPPAPCTAQGSLCSLSIYAMPQAHLSPMGSVGRGHSGQ